MYTKECKDKIIVCKPFFIGVNNKIKRKFAIVVKKIFIVSLTVLLCACSKIPYSSENNSEPDYENPYLIDQISEAVLIGDDVKARKIAEQVKENYPDTLDSAMADTYISIIDKRQESREQEYENIDFKQYIQLYSVKTSKPNSVGGIDLYIKWKNVSAKTIKYAYFDCSLYNAVDDVVENTITGSYSFTGKETGPIEPGETRGNNEYWSCAWYNSSGKYAKVTKIRIEYMDGSEIAIPESKINELFY